MPTLLRVAVTLTLFCLVVGISACGASEATGTVVKVRPAEAVVLIAEGEHMVIDVRSPREYRAAHLEGAVNIDVDAPDFEERVADLDRDGQYLLYSARGPRSARAGDVMADLDFEHVVDAGSFALLVFSGAPVA